VAVLAGTAFGAMGTGYLRLSYAQAVPVLERGVEKIGEFLTGDAAAGLRQAATVATGS